MKIDTIHNKSCQSMSELADSSIDLLATDPPFGIAFMGKSWDRAIPPVAIWRECLRVLKPGAFALVMCIPRQDCLARMIISLEDTGFNTSFTSIYHCFAQGFPKAGNIAKMVDKRLGAERKVIGTKECGYQVSISKKRKEEGYRPNLTRATKEVDITLPATPQAKALDGSYAGFQPKPAVEVVLVAMKPLAEKTYVDQALKNGKGISWLDEGRIPYRSPKDIDKAKIGFKGDILPPSKGWNENKVQRTKFNQQNGRFPANLLVSGDALNDGRMSKTNSKGGTRKAGNEFGQDSGWNDHKNIDSFRQGISDSGSFSRYFSLDAWWEKRLRELPPGVQRTFPFLIVPKAGKAEKSRGCERLEQKPGYNYGSIKKSPGRTGINYARGNSHPTCKPLKLMSYLITLGSRVGDTVLDPFIGSGTTAIAARMLRRHFIGYEIEADYCKIAEARLSVVQEQLI